MRKDQPTSSGGNRSHTGSVREKLRRVNHRIHEIVLGKERGGLTDIWRISADSVEKNKNMKRCPHRLRNIKKKEGAITDRLVLRKKR